MHIKTKNLGNRIISPFFVIFSGRAEGHPLPLGDDDEDWIDTGAAILNFYCTLVDLLGR